MGVVPVGPTGAALNSRYNNRDSPAYKTDLGLALVRPQALLHVNAALLVTLMIIMPKAQLRMSCNVYNSFRSGSAAGIILAWCIMWPGAHDVATSLLMPCGVVRLIWHQVNWARIVPDGLLVFFPSYVVMAACIAHWKSAAASSSAGPGKVLDFAGTIWDRITKHKQAVVEPRVRPHGGHLSLLTCMQQIARLLRATLTITCLLAFGLALRVGMVG